MRTFWIFAGRVGAVVIGLFVLALIVGSGWCAGRHNLLDNLHSNVSTADVHVTAQPGQNVEAVVKIGSAGTESAGRPAWRVNYQLCQDHFVYDLGQAPAGKCDYLLTKQVDAPPPAVTRSRQPRPPPPAPCNCK